MTKTPDYVIRHHILRVADKVMQLNQNTELAAWLDITGHCNSISVSVAKSKEDYSNKIYEYRSLSYSGILLREDFEEEVNKIINDLTELEVKSIKDAQEEKIRTDLETLERLRKEYPNA